MSNQERWKERVELSLDGRQIFFLFFGSAVLACLLFVAGVLVGRRIEQRSAPPLRGEDPLAALDQIDSADSNDGLTFPDKLVRDRAPARAAAPRPARGEEARAAPRRPDGDRKPEADPARKADPAHKPDSAARPTPGEGPAPASRFTLQLSSFSEKTDADMFAARLKAAGMSVQVVRSDIPGKGTYYRVRSGDYKTRQEAAQAKGEYEKLHGGGALIAPL